MTGERLHEVLHERVADLPGADLVDAAWARARRTRQRRAVALVSGAVVAVVAVAGGVVVGLGGGDDAEREPAAPASSGATSTPAGAEPRGSYAGAQVWQAPDVADEPNLPRLQGGPLPAEVDLSGAGPVAAGIGRAVAVFEVDDDRGLDRVVAVGEDGTSYTLDVAGIDPWADSGGNRLSPLSRASLAPDGERVFLRQTGALAVYDFGTDEWTRIDLDGRDPEDTWWATDRLLVVPAEGAAPGLVLDADGTRVDTPAVDPPPPVRLLTDDEPYGVPVDARDAIAQGLVLSGDPSRAGPDLRSREGVAVRWGGQSAVLVVPDGPGRRWLQCCPVVGWLDEATVLLESRHSRARVLAWRAGTEELSRVADIRGWRAGDEAFVGSYAIP